VERIPAIEAPSEERESPQTVEEEPERAEPRPDRVEGSGERTETLVEKSIQRVGEMQDDQTAQDARRLLVAFSTKPSWL
jgi:hypothetical protein